MVGGMWNKPLIEEVKINGREKTKILSRPTRGIQKEAKFLLEAYDMVQTACNGVVLCFDLVPTALLVWLGRVYGSGTQDLSATMASKTHGQIWNNMVWYGVVQHRPPPGQLTAVNSKKTIGETNFQAADSGIKVEAKYSGWQNDGNTQSQLGGSKREGQLTMGG